LDRANCGILPTGVWHLPALKFIGLGMRRIEDTNLADVHPIPTTCLAISWYQDDPCGTLKSFLRLSPFLTHLKVSKISGMSLADYFYHKP